MKPLSERIRPSVRWRIGMPFALLLWALSLITPVAAQDQQPTPDPTLGVITGQVANLTAGAEPVAGIPITLYALIEMEPVAHYTTTVESDGGFVFRDVELVEGHVYVATLDFQHVTYGSQFTTLYNLGDSVHLKVDVYQATNDPATLSVSRLHVVVEFEDQNIVVAELYIIGNLSDRVFSGATGDPNDGVVELPIPPETVSSEMQRGMNDGMVPALQGVIRTATGYLDTFPVRPGAERQLMVTYVLPYDGDVAISHPLPYRVESATLFLASGDLAVDSPVFQRDAGADGGATAGMPFDQYHAAGLAAGEILSFRISGAPDLSGETAPRLEQAAASPLFAGAGDNAVTWTVGVLAMAGALAAAGFSWRRWRDDAGRVRTERDDLLQAIVDLDAEHAAGKIPAARYDLERELLKSELRNWYQGL